MTHLQFIALVFISKQPGISSSQLQIRFSEFKEPRSGPAFYRLMFRLEESGWTYGTYEKHDVNGQIVRIKRYYLTPAGSVALLDRKRDYESLLKGIE